MNISDFGTIFSNVSNLEETEKALSLFDFFYSNNMLELNSFNSIVLNVSKLDNQLSDIIFQHLLTKFKSETIFNESSFSYLITGYRCGGDDVFSIIQDYCSYNITRETEVSSNVLKYYNNDVIHKYLNNYQGSLRTIKNIDFIHKIAEKGIELKPEHFICSFLPIKEISKFVDVNKSFDICFPVKENKININLYNLELLLDKLKNNKNDKKEYCKIDPIHPELSFLIITSLYKTYLNKNDFFTNFKTGNFDHLKINNISAYEYLLFYNIDYLKQMIDINRLKDTNFDNFENKKSYIENNKYLKQIPDIINKLYLISLLEMEKSSELQSNLLKTLDIIEKNKEKKALIEYGINYFNISRNRIKLNNRAYKYKEALFHGLNENTYKIKNSLYDNFIINLMPVNHNNRQINSQFYSVFSNIEKGLLVSLQNIKSNPTFFYGFINDEFRTIHKNTNEMKLFTEAEQLYFLTNNNPKLNNKGVSL